jgi:hypothetical protein
VIEVSKSTVTRPFLAGVVAVVAGIVLAVAAVLTGFADGAIKIGGPDVVTISGGPFAWAVFGLVLAALAIAGGALICLIAWIGALLNTAQLDDKTWFLVLLVLGLWNFGFVAMVAYIVAGPDGAPRTAAAPTGATPAHI